MIREIQGDYSSLVKDKSYPFYGVTINKVVGREGLVMGAGIAKEAVKLYPSIKSTAGSLVSAGFHCKILTLNEDVSGTMPQFILFPTKYHWRDSKASLSLIEQSATELVRIMSTQEKLGYPCQVLLPAPGCGNGNLPWSTVKRVLDMIPKFDRYVTVLHKKEREIPIYNKLDCGNIVAVTGHRPHRLGWGYDITVAEYAELAKSMAAYLREIQPRLILSGMALGVDQVACYVAKQLGIPYDAYVPFKGFSNRWPMMSQRRYKELINGARAVRLITNSDTPIESDEITECLRLRNKALVANSTHLFAVLKKNELGGTAHCVNYATKEDRVAITQIDPAIVEHAVDLQLE
jgi:uncharacterized phage-like protein YoqJ